MTHELYSDHPICAYVQKFAQPLDLAVFGPGVADPDNAVPELQGRRGGAVRARRVQRQRVRLAGGQGAAGACIRRGRD